MNLLLRLLLTIIVKISSYKDHVIWFRLKPCLKDTMNRPYRPLSMKVLALSVVDKEAGYKLRMVRPFIT